MTDHDRPLIDWGRPPLCLGAAGHVHAAIRPDGATEYWLMRDEDDPNATRPRTPAHEHDGPLPPSIRERVRAHRCGAKRADGGRCRMQVAAPGDLCHHHRAGPEIVTRVLGAHVIDNQEDQ